jgi:hypothetical protein
MTSKHLVVPVLMTMALLLLVSCGAAQPTATKVPATKPPTLRDPTPASRCRGRNHHYLRRRAVCLQRSGERTCRADSPGAWPSEINRPTRGTLSAFTLDEGKTGDDLRATDGSHTPLWAQFHGSVDALPGAVQETTIILFEGPLFLGCQTSSPVVNVNVVGPIEIEPTGSK